MKRIIPAACLAIVGFVVPACGLSGVGGSSDASQAYPAAPPPDPPQITSFGGALLGAPRIVPVFFASDAPAILATLTDFVKRIGQSQYWQGAVAEYGVGPAVGEDPILLTAGENPPPVLDQGLIEAWLAATLDGDDPRFGVPDANTLYSIFYPPGITISLGTPSGATSCDGLGGFHGSVQMDAAHNGRLVAYAAIPRCSPFGAAGHGRGDHDRQPRIPRGGDRPRTHREPCVRGDRPGP